MNHLNRVLAVAVTTALLIAVAAPPAQALSLRELPAPRVIGGDLLDAALSWLSHVFGGTPQATETQPAQKKKPSTSEGGSGGLGGVSPMTGSCIDPGGCETGG